MARWASTVEEEKDGVGAGNRGGYNARAPRHRPTRVGVDVNRLGYRIRLVLRVSPVVCHTRRRRLHASDAVPKCRQDDLPDDILLRGRRRLQRRRAARDLVSLGGLCVRAEAAVARCGASKR